MVSAANKEASLGSYEAVDSLLRVSGEPGGVEYEVEDDRDLVGGEEESTTQEVSVRRYEAAIAQSKVKPHTLAFILAAGLGSHSHSTPAGATTARLHTISPDTSAYEHETFTVEELLISGLQRKYGGCFVDSFELSGDRRNFFSLSAQVYGSGKFTTGSASVSEKSENSLHTRDSVCWLSTGAYDGSTPTQGKGVNDLGGTPSDIRASIDSFRWAYNNNSDLDFLYSWGSGITMGRAERDERSQEISATLLLEDATHLNYLNNQTPLAMQIKCHNSSQQIGAEGYYYGFILVFPKLMYNVGRPRGAAGGRMTVDITTSIKQDATHGSVEAWVYNTQASYLQ